jgi:hypothetical protein
LEEAANKEQKRNPFPHRRPCRLAAQRAMNLHRMVLGLNKVSIQKKLPNWHN